MEIALTNAENSKLNRARANTAFIASVPRFIIETVGVVLIAGLAVAISNREGGLAAALPVLGALALGAQRLLPLVQQIYTGWSSATGHMSVLDQTLELLRLPIAEEHRDLRPVKPLPLRDAIELEQVSFTYRTRHRPAVDGVTLKIAAGSTIALVGPTGSGKSSLGDLLMGLLEPSEGRVCVDGVPLSRKNRRRWQRSIAHVPQSIFLADSTIARNIALSDYQDGVDLERVIEAARRAQLHEFVQSLEDGYQTPIGERGVRLSGGQKQRLGIARAIYKRAPVLVLDEPTSALDEETEAAVMDGLRRLGEEGLTVIIITHRHSAVARCDTVARLKNGRLVDVATIRTA